MRLPDFYELAPVVQTRDPFAEMLGAARDGLLEYSYADAVRLAGHSCPTVAGAFLVVVPLCARYIRMSLLKEARLPCICPRRNTRGRPASWRRC